MSNENALLDLDDIENIDEKELEIDESSFSEQSLESLEKELEKDLQEKMSDVKFLEEEKEKIKNPDKLGKVIEDQMIKEMGLQLGMDLTSETLNQKYDLSHPESYGEIAASIMACEEYKKANKKMKEEQASGNLKDEYTGKIIKQNEKANLDHVVPRKVIFENQRRRQANLSVSELANMGENLKATNEALNKSKGAKTNSEYVAKREEREDSLKKGYEKKCEKIDNSNVSDLEKRELKEKAKKAMNDKLSADDDLMLKAEKNANKAINKKIRKEGAKKIGGKALSDAIKAFLASGLIELIKNIVSGFVSFIKEKSKSFKSFLIKMKDSIKSFFSRIKNIFINEGLGTAIGSVVTEIFGPIVSLFKKVSSMIKEGARAFIEAFKFLANKENQNKPLYEKVAGVGKIITGTAIGIQALFLGEVFEKALLTVPVFAFQIPLLGSLANILGLVLASIVSGIIGAIIMNLINRYVSKREKDDLVKEEIKLNNEIIATQNKLIGVKKEDMKNQKENVYDSLKERHEKAYNYMKDALKDFNTDDSENDVSDSEFSDMLKMLNKNV